MLVAALDFEFGSMEQLLELRLPLPSLLSLLLCVLPQVIPQLELPLVLQHLLLFDAQSVFG